MQLRLLPSLQPEVETGVYGAMLGNDETDQGWSGKTHIYH